MSQQKVNLLKEIDISKIRHGPKKPRGRSESCAVSYDTSKEFIIQCPKLRAPFGLGEPKEEFKTDKAKYYLDCSLNTDEKYDKNGQIALFKKFLNDLDDLNVKYISDNSEAWFGEHSSVAEVRKHVYKNPLVKKYVPKDKSSKTTYPDRFTINLPFYNGGQLFKVFDGNSGKEISFTESNMSSWIEKGKPTDIVPIIQCDGMWVIGQRVYCNFKAVGVKVYNQSGLSITENSFRTEEVADVPTEEAAVSD